MLYGNYTPGEPQLGDIFPSASDFTAMSLGILDGMAAGSYHRFFRVRDNDDKIFR